MKLLDAMGVSDHLDINEMSFDELIGKAVAEKVVRRRFIPAKALTTLGVDRRELDRKIQAGKLVVKTFELDSLGRKINKRFSREEVLKEYPDLTARLED